MNSNDKDFIDKFIDFCSIYKASGVRFFALIISFILLFIFGVLFAPTLIKILHESVLFNIQFIQLSPYEVLYNYVKIAFFFALFLISPFFVYQFGKLRIEEDTQEEKASRMSISLVLMLIIIVSVILTYKVLLPAELMILYGLNFSIATPAASLSAIISTFLFTYFVTLMLILFPYIRYLMKKAKFFTHEELTKYKKPVTIYLAILTAIIAMPLEIISLAVVFLTFYFWYKILVHYSEKKDKNGF